MLSFLLLLLAVSQSIKVMKWSHLYVGPGYNEKEIKKEYEEIKKNQKEICQEDEDEGYDMCMAFYDAMQEFKYSKGSDINDVLKKVPKSTEFLIIVGFQMAEIDLNNLKAQMKVAFEYDDYVDEEYSLKKNNHFRNLVKRMMKVSFDGSDTSIMELSRTRKHKSHKIAKYSEDPVLFVGDIKKKVSFLGIDEGYIKFTKSDINCHSLGLSDVAIAEDSTKIRTNFLLVGPGVHSELYETLVDTDFVQVNQYTMKISSDNPSSSITYNITYGEDSWILNWDKDYRSTKSGDDDGYFIPYNRASIFNLLTNAKDFIISRKIGVNLEKYPPINITSMITYSYTEFWAKKLEKKSITIKQENFDDIEEEKRPKITLIYDPELYEFNKDENNFFNVIPDTKFSYKPQNRKDVNVGMIVGIVVACVVVVVVVIVVVIIVIRKKRNTQNSASEKEADA